MANNLPLGLIYRCSGPNCGVLKTPDQDGWWLLWTTIDAGVPTLTLAPWDEELAHREATLFACGENCAHKLQSNFMSNLTANRVAREASAR
jgi:hypothetical protein